MSQKENIKTILLCFGVKCFAKYLYLNQLHFRNFFNPVVGESNMELNYHVLNKRF